MDLLSIGEPARRTGLTVKAIRFYSDEGIVPPAERSQAGYRRYGVAAVARLDLLRTLRELGLDLPTIRRVLDREVTLAEVAAAHADALAAQIGVIRRRSSGTRSARRRRPAWTRPHPGPVRWPRPSWRGSRMSPTSGWRPCWRPRTIPAGSGTGQQGQGVDRASIHL